MRSKFGIFLVNGENSRYGEAASIGLTKQHIGDFDTLDEAEAYLRDNPRITPQHFVMEFWIPE